MPWQLCWHGMYQISAQMNHYFLNKWIKFYFDKIHSDGSWRYSKMGLRNRMVKPEQCSGHIALKTQQEKLQMQKVMMKIATNFSWLGGLYLFK